MICPIT